jgi:hypothetical protein
MKNPVKVLIFVIMFFGYAYSSAESLDYKPIVVHTAKHSYDADAIGIVTMYLFRHNPAYLGGLMLFSTVGNALDEDTEWPEGLGGLALGTGVSTGLFILQNNSERDNIMSGLAVSVLSIDFFSSFIPQDKLADAKATILNKSVFESKDQGINIQTSNAIYKSLRKNGYIRNTSDYFGKLTDKIQSESDIEGIALDDKYLSHKAYVVWVLKQIYLFEKNGKNESVVY